MESSTEQYLRLKKHSAEFGLEKDTEVDKVSKTEGQKATYDSVNYVEQTVLEEVVKLDNKAISTNEVVSKPTTKKSLGALIKGWLLFSECDRPEIYEIQRFLEVAQEYNIDLQVIDPARINLTVTRDGKDSVLLDNQLVSLPDFVIPRTGSKTTYFELAVMRHLERLGLPCFNAANGIETVRDKLFSQQIMARNNLPIPKTMLAKFPVDLPFIEKQIGFPIVVKTISGTQGVGVYLSQSRTKFVDLMHLLEATNKNTNIVLQQYIESSHGRDLRVFTIGGRAVACIERNSGSKDDFKANYSQGGNMHQHPITPEIEWLATETARTLGLDIAGVDLLFDGDHFKICEANSSPGFKGLEECCGISIPEQVFKYIRIRLGKF